MKETSGMKEKNDIYDYLTRLYNRKGMSEKWNDILKKE